MNEPTPPKALLARPAPISIVGLWLFYFLLTSLRALVLDLPDQLWLLERRIVVSGVGMALTFGLYLVLRHTARASLGIRVAAAFSASLPFAMLFGAINYTAFYVYDPIGISIAADPPDGHGPGGAAGAQVLTPTAMIVDSAVTWYFIFVAWSALYLALGYAGQAIAAERRAADARAAAQTAELRALRYQVNPHFLFNTLNSLSSLVLTNQPERAERMIMNLATFFRTSLSAEPADDVALAEEIRLQQLYLEIEKIRFPDRLRVVLAIPDALLDACVPGLILQPLVENAIKYGVSRARRPVTLTIAAEAHGDRLALRVADDGDPQPDAAPAESHGVGLANVASRLRARFGDDADARWGPSEPHGFAVTLAMPLVRHGC